MTSQLPHDPHHPYNQYPQQAWPPPAQPAPKRRRKWPWIVGGIVLLLIIIGSVGNAKPATPTVVNAGPAASQAQAATPTGPASTITDGTYQVGVDMVAGRYKTNFQGSTGMCYWERSKDDSGQFTSIISNDNLQGPGSVTVKKGEFFKVSGGCTWTKQ